MASGLVINWLGSNDIENQQTVGGKKQMEFKRHSKSYLSYGFYEILSGSCYI